MIDLARGDVLEVRNWNAPEASSPGMWPCGLCRDPHPVTRSWYVELETDEGRFSVVACEACARGARQDTVV